MKTLFLFLVSSTSLFSASFSDYRTHLERYEGNKSSVYLCSKGYKTIGIGVNLDAKFPNNTYKIGNRIRADLITRWEKEEISKAEDIAKRVFPSFNSQPDNIKIILVSLCYNLGESGINKFVKFKRAIHLRNYKIASNELKDSLWYRQTGKRGKDYVEKLKNFN